MDNWNKYEIVNELEKCYTDIEQEYLSVVNYSMLMEWPEKFLYNHG
jgi:hypothetical protein